MCHRILCQTSLESQDGQRSDIKENNQMVIEGLLINTVTESKILCFISLVFH